MPINRLSVVDESRKSDAKPSSATTRLRIREAMHVM